MTKYITATVIVERLIEEKRSLFIQGDKLELLIRQLSACDRETAILEREVSQLKAENHRLRIQIRERDKRDIPAPSTGAISSVTRGAPWLKHSF